MTTMAMAINVCTVEKKGGHGEAGAGEAGAGAQGALRGGGGGPEEASRTCSMRLWLLLHQGAADNC